MSPFQPKGSRALRIIVLEMAKDAGYGEILTFGDLASAIGVPDDDAGRAQVRQAVSTARPLLLQDYSRALVAVRGKGYRVALPGEYAGLAQVHRRKADRQLGQALAHIEFAPTTEMNKDELRRFQAVGMVIRNLHGRVTDAEQRIADLEAAVFDAPRSVIRGNVIT